MPGQLGTGSFNVKDLVIEEPAGSDMPTNTIPQGGTFDLSLTFEGNGAHWVNMTNLPLDYEVYYYVEGIGITSDDEKYGPATGTLAPGKLTYKGPDTKFTVANNNLKPGIYRVTGIVLFPKWPGTTGFVEDNLMQVYSP